MVFQASGRYVQQAYPTCPLNNVYDPQTNIKYLALIGDGVCQFSKGKGINVVECGWDDGDCEILNERYPACDVQEFSRLGDGKCDAGEYNSIFCGFDHGDCLRSNREIIKEFPNCTVSNPGWLGNGICNGGEYMKDCGNDFGDCNNCNVNNFLLIGNGNCNGGNYNTEECSFDGGDCLQKNKELQYKYRNCSVTNIGWIEDGFCDEGDYNIKECYFDGGDCVPSFALVGNEFEGPAKWDGAVKGEDGMIYGIPLNAKNILKFDPSSKTTSVIGDNFDSGSLKWRGGVNGHDGLIYGVPYNAEYVLQYDPKSEKISRIAEGHDLLISKAKFSGGVVAGDGQIYFMPFHFPQSIKFDPTNAVEPLKLVEGDFENVWGGVLGGDGNVYGIPHHGKKVTKITVENDEISFIGDNLSDLGDAKWSNGILGQDGNIYACPFNANQILQINILSQSTNLVGPDLGNDDSKWAGFVEGSDGFLYGIPSFSNKLLRFDPILHTATMIPLDDQLKNLEPLKTWSGAILDENGMIFMFPQDTKQILELTPFSLKQNF